MKADDYVYPLEFADESYHEGITARDYIAIQAMNGMVSCGDYTSNDKYAMIQHAFAIADAMITESEKKIPCTR